MLTSSPSTAGPVTSMPDAISLRRSTRANQAVGLPADTLSVAGMPPTGTEPAIVSTVSPGRISGQTSVALPAAPVTLRFVIGRACASTLKTRLVDPPTNPPGFTVTVRRVLPRVRGPAHGPGRRPPRAH